jgi:hypothetical protein
VILNDKTAMLGAARRAMGVVGGKGQGT